MRVGTADTRTRWADRGSEVRRRVSALAAEVWRAWTVAFAVLLAPCAAGLAAPAAGAASPGRDGAVVSAATAGEPGDMSWLQRTGSGAAEANYYIDLLADADVAALQYVADRYYLFSAGDGTWGNGWLSKFVVYDLGVRAFELRSQLPGALAEQIDRIMEDAVDERTFRVDTSCGIDPWNSCSEDFGSMLKAVATVRQLFPNVVARVGDGALRLLEEEYFRLAFSTEAGTYALTVQTSPIDGNAYVMMNNHGGQSAVYGGVLLIELANAFYAYWLAGTPLPEFYRDPAVLATIASLFGWLQLTATPDGRSYVNGCLDARGEIGPCDDPGVSSAIPRFIPAGRVARVLLGEGAFLPGRYDFRAFDPTYGAGNCWNRGRRLQYGARNPDWVPVRVSPAAPLALEWEAQADATRYEVWGPGGRVASTDSPRFTFAEVPAGAFDVGVVARGGEYDRATGVGFSPVDGRRVARRVRR
ncbi:MAG TPA: hypothetical protein VMT19_07045 [Thermoanaerobaculaceae bacterium]|nr:hypothetical protein [Thermoanaerobaculaceae bacterium]